MNLILISSARRFQIAVRVALALFGITSFTTNAGLNGAREELSRVRPRSTDLSVGARICVPGDPCAVPSVSPKDGARVVPPGSTSDAFTVTNVGDASGTLYFNSVCSGIASGCTVSPSSAFLGVNASSTVTVSYTAASTGGTGEVRLHAENQGAIYEDEGWINVTVAQNPMISLGPHNGDNRDVSLCIADCFDALLSYSTPAYVSMGTARSVTLLYRKQQAAPTATITADVRDTTVAQSPTQLSIKVKNLAGTYVTLLGNRQEIFYSYQPGAWNRIAVEFDVTGLATGAYDYTVEVTSHFTNNATKVASSLARVLVVNEQSSILGAGWSVAGWQRVLAQSSGGAVVTDGTGSITYFTGPCAAAPCTYVSPPGEFSTLSRQNGGDGTAFKRRYPDGDEVYYLSDGRMAYAQDRFGNRTTYGYDSGSRLATITDPTGRVVAFGYESTPSQSSYKAGTLRWIDDGGGRRAEFGVDAANNLIYVKDVDGVTALASSYDVPNRLRSWTDRRGSTWNVDYDCWRYASVVTMPSVIVNGVSTRPVRRQAAPVQQTALCESSSNGTSTNPLPAALADNVRGSTTDARGVTTQYQLDGFGAPMRIEEPLGRTTVITRNTNSQPTYLRSPGGGAVVWSWSGSDLTETYDSTTGLRTTFHYEPLYHQLSSRWDGVVRDSNFWSGGKLDSSDVGTLGTRRTRYTYETISGRVTGRVATVKDPAGHVVSYAYLSSGSRNLSTVSAAGRSAAHGYDALGRPQWIVSPTGDTTWTAYDLLNRVTQSIGSQRDTTLFGYDAIFPTSLRDAQHQTYWFTPNALGWVESQTDPAARNQTIAYDSAGNVKRITNRRGQIIDFTYDGLGNIATRTADGATTTYTIDPLDRFIAASNVESTDTSRFDAADRQIAEITVRGSLRFDRISTYGAQGLRTGLSVSPWQSTRGFRYSDKLDLDTLIDAGGGRTVFEHNSEGGTNAINLPTTAGLRITRDYPGNHTPSQITYSVSIIDDAIRTFFAYGDNGLIARRIKRSTPTEETGRAYSYDKLRRLTGYADYSTSNGQYLCAPGTNYVVDPVTGEPCWQEGSRTSTDSSNYQYDLVGNRSDSGAVVTAGNRMVRFRGDTIVYDADGNMAKRWLLAGGRVDSLVWNSLGELVSVTRNGVMTSFGYDAFGRRVRKTTGSTVTRYLHDTDELLAELDGSGNRIAEYTYYPGIDRPHSVRRWSGGVATTYYYATDHPGNVVGLIDNANALVNRYSYAPFGARQDSAGTVLNSLRYAGRELDDETGLYYNRARYYDPTLGRFISEDPIGLAAGVNVYVYVDDNPISGIDPYGLQSCETTILTSIPEDVYYANPEAARAYADKVCSGSRDITIWGSSSPISFTFGGGGGYSGGGGGSCSGACGIQPLLAYHSKFLNPNSRENKDPYHNWSKELDPEIVLRGCRVATGSGRYEVFAIAGLAPVPSSDGSYADGYYEIGVVPNLGNAPGAYFVKHRFFRRQSRAKYQLTC